METQTFLTDLKKTENAPKRPSPDSASSELHKGEYYDQIASGYDELYKDEQVRKLTKIFMSLPEDMVPKKSQSLLDVGCGSGISTEPWDSFCVGIDPSIELIKVAQTNYPKKHFLVGHAENLPFKEDTFDFVISLTAIHNFSEIKKGILEIKRVGKRFFILSILKKSSNLDNITKLVMINFRIRKIIQEDKDIIFLCEKLIQKKKE